MWSPTADGHESGATCGPAIRERYSGSALPMAVASVV